jgi:hypothetical protein
VTKFATDDLVEMRSVMMTIIIIIRSISRTLINYNDRNSKINIFENIDFVVPVRLKFRPEAPDIDSTARFGASFMEVATAIVFETKISPLPRECIFLKNLIKIKIIRIVLTVTIIISLLFVVKNRGPSIQSYLCKQDNKMHREQRQ